MDATIKKIEKFYNINLNEIIEDENEYSKVEHYRNSNTYCKNSAGKIIKLNLKDNYIDDLSGLREISNFITHLNLAGNNISDIKLLSKFKKLQLLDLSTNKISEIQPISNLTNLLFLLLDNNSITEIPVLNLPNILEFWIYSNRIENLANISTLNNVRSLNISQNLIKDINPLSTLINITNLAISDNQIENIDVLDKLGKIQFLYSSKNKIKDISIFLKIKKIENLDLSQNQIIEIFALKDIEINGDLFLGQNQIFDLSPLYFSLKNNKINFLNIFENPLIYPTSEIATMGESQIVEWFDSVIENCNNKIDQLKGNILDLGMLGLTDLNLIPRLFKLYNLEKLILSNHYAEYNEDGKYWEKTVSINHFLPNNIYNIPSEIKNLKNLKKLIIGGDWKKGEKWNRWRIIEIAPVFSLKNLEYLNVSNNLIEKIEIKNSVRLEKLKIIHLNNNNIITFNTLTKFPNLEELYLSNNALKTVNNLKNILSLKTIDLHSNKITNVKPLLKILNNSSIDISQTKWEKNTINIQDNPLKEPNYETIHTGKDAVVRYFENKNDWKKVVNKDIKIILVGNSEVGKSTLVKYLDGEKDLDKPHEATHWMIEKDISSKNIIKKLNEKCNIRVFDFGGQDYYHDTHHIFFTGNTIYLLLWDEKTNQFLSRPLFQNVKGKSRNTLTQDYQINYWLESVKHHIKVKSNIIIENKVNFEYDSQLLLIQNKVSKINEIISVNNLDFKKNYPFINDFININIIPEKRNLDHFDNLLTEVINDMNVVGSNILEYQNVIRNALKSYDGKPILNFIEFTAYCNSKLRKNISDDEVKDLCSYLKQLGLLFYLPYLKKIYIDKKWVLKNTYDVLEKLIEFDGEFDKEFLSDNVKLETSNDLIEGLLELMIEFKIVFQNPINKKYIAPLYLPDKPLEGIDLFLMEKRIAYRRFEYNGFIHKTIILDFFHEYGNKTISEEKKFYYWKSGLIIKDDKTEQILHIKFEVGDEFGNAYIDIFKINNEDKESIFVNEIISFIKKINNKFFKLDQKNIDENKEIVEDYYEEMVTVNNVDFVSLKLLNENAEKKKFIFNERKVERENVENEKFEKDINLVDFKKFLNNTNIMKKIFISYSKDDLDLVMSFINSLQSLVIDGVIDQPWFCTYLQPGDEVHNKIREKMAEADIICFMCSNNFYKTKYIIEKELKPTIQKYNEDQKQIILPIIIDRCRWILDKKEINLGNFSGFPYRGKPVVSYYNWNDAWYVTNYFLEQVIKNRLVNDKELFDSFGDLPSDIIELLKLQAAGNLNK